MEGTRRGEKENQREHVGNPATTAAEGKDGHGIQAVQAVCPCFGNRLPKETAGAGREQYVHEPEYEERPVDEFSNIDLIISTPESIEDAKRRLEEARGYAEATALEAQKAREEMVRLEQLVALLVFK